ncbi:histidine phosphatase family protein [Actinocrinis puniceicyclus]|uniref:Histidine phosphatase family protein n=1 Tax=Actinocrinis puniceicyclus TaxID=977794 RepID=A0A8J7WQA0_9ACTN|nr:histidine phosphatase family protein [Actinocrinis puniceicyclus]
MAPDSAVAGRSAFDRHAYHAPGRRVVVWRHGQTEWNVEGRFQGQTDVPLDAVGRDQARRAARLLAALRPHAIVASDLSRAAETARELSALTGLGVALDAGLRETFAGTWQGLTDNEIREKFPEQFAAWKRDHSVRRGGGELETEVADRVVPAILRALDGVPAGGTLVVVSHGGSSRVAIGRLLGLPAEHWSSLGGLSNCCWSVLGEATRGWRLLEHNAGSLPEPVIGDDAEAEAEGEVETEGEGEGEGDSEAGSETAAAAA